MIRLPVHTPFVSGTSIGVTTRWRSVYARRRVSLSESEWVLNQTPVRGNDSLCLPTPSAPRPHNLLTPCLLSYYLLQPLCFSAFIPLPRPKWQLVKHQALMPSGKRRKIGGRKELSRAERQADWRWEKNKTLKGKKQSSTPSWASISIGSRGDQLELRGGALPLRSKARPPMCPACECVCAWACLRKVFLQACFFFPRRTLEAPTCAYLCTSNRTFIALTCV